MIKDTQYKNTSIGLIPNDWEVRKLSKILLKDRLGGNYDNSENNEGIPVIKMGNLERGNINTLKLQFLPSNSEYNKEDVLQYGDLLFNTRNTLELVGKVAIWKNELPYALYNSNLLKLDFSKAYISSNYFMNYLFNSRIILKQLRGFATGTTSVAAIYSRDLKLLQLPIPPLAEQQKIAEILSTWDKAIQETNRIIEALEKRNKGLVFSLLTGKIRLKEFESIPSMIIKIKDVAKEITLKNKEDNNYTVFSCTKYNGLVPSLEYFGKKIYSDNLKTYKIIKRNQFVYATNHVEEGSIGILEKEEFGLISPMYTVFEFNDNVNLDYIFKMLKSDFYINEYKRRMEGSINRRGGLRWNSFCRIKINLPSFEEQNAIAEILNKANQEVKQYQQKLEALKLQKKGLMQQLLTGKVRTN